MPTDPAPEKVAALRFADVRKAITDSYYDTREEGGTMETAADLAATRVMNLASQAAGYDVARIEEGPVSEASLGVALLEDPDGAPYPDEVQRAFADRVRGRIEEGERLRAALRDAAGRAHMLARHDLIGHLSTPIAFEECQHLPCPTWRAALAASDEAVRP